MFDFNWWCLTLMFFLAPSYVFWPNVHPTWNTKNTWSTKKIKRIPIYEHNCAIETSSLNEKVKNKFHTKLKSKTSKYK
jgi:hypothetical protein